MRKLDIAEGVSAADRKERRTEHEKSSKKRAEKRESRKRLKVENSYVMMEMVMHNKKYWFTVPALPRPLSPAERKVGEVETVTLFSRHSLQRRHSSKLGGEQLK